MKKFKVSAYSLEEAKAKALEQGIIVASQVTQSWKNAGCPIEGPEFKAFAVEILGKKHLTDIEGAGLIIALKNGSKDTRDRPYKYVNNVVKGKRETKRVVEIRLKSTNELIGEESNKGKAEKLAKKLMAKYRQDIIAPIVYRVTGGKEIAFELEYTPSASATMGEYIVFGNEKKESI